MMNFKETLKFIPMVHKTDLVPLLLGHTGIGKTQLIEQYAESIGYNLIVIHVAQLEPSDFVGLYKTTEDGRTMNCPPNWLPYLKEIGDSKKVEVIEGDNKKGYIVFLDEINRGHEDIRQAMYQFLTTKKIHTYSAPPNTHIVAAANPASLYECYEFDDALVNRFANIKFKPEIDECLTYLEKKHGKNMLSTWMMADKGLLDLGDDDFEIKGLKLTPRILDNTIALFREMEHEPSTFQRKALETVIPADKVASFLAFLDEIKHINHVDVINGVKGEKIKELMKNHRVDILSTIVNDLGDLFYTFELGTSEIKKMVKGIKVTEKEALANVAQFLKDCPSEMDTMFINLLKETYEKKTCILNDAEFAKALKEKLGSFKEVLQASKKSK